MCTYLHKLSKGETFLVFFRWRPFVFPSLSFLALPSVPISSGLKRTQGQKSPEAGGGDSGDPENNLGLWKKEIDPITNGCVTFYLPYTLAHKKWGIALTGYIEMF